MPFSRGLQAEVRTVENNGQSRPYPCSPYIRIILLLLYISLKRPLQRDKNQTKDAREITEMRES